MKVKHLLTTTFFATMMLLWSGVGWGQTPLIDENIQDWTNRSSYGSYTQAIDAGDVLMTQCIVQSSASANGDCSTGRVQMQGSNGIIELPEVSSVSDVVFTIVAGGAGRSIKLQKFEGADWVDVVTFSSIGTVGATYTHSMNTSSPVKLRLAGASSAVYVHDIIIYDLGAVPPSITNITHTPAVDITSTDAVSVSADVTEGDAALNNVELRWGTTSGDYISTITMTVGAGDTYASDLDIPAQADGTTVYYVVFADDADGESTTSSEKSYTVTDPASTTLPYEETFDVDLGDCYVYSVDGTKPWTHSSSSAMANGFGSENPEEHWLVLPAINFDSYANEVMNFSTYAQYGDLDANNYLKLFYSADYPGIGDPTGYTWAELTFDQPEVGPIGSSVIETPSGDIDLTGVVGTDVYLAFKYYSTDSPTGWRVDNINIFEATVYATTESVDLNISVDYATAEVDAIAQLASTVAINGAEGEVGEATIEWTIDSYDGETPADYTATGVLTLPDYWIGTPANVTATVTVNPAATIYASTEVINFDISVIYGTSEVDAISQLASTVKIYGTESEEGDATIDWTIASYDGNTPADYTATGVLALPAGWSGDPANVTATVTVLEFVSVCPFATSFTVEENWNLVTAAGTYGEKIYEESGWHFQALSTTRDASDTYDGSSYTFRNRDDFTITNQGPLTGITGFRIYIRNWSVTADRVVKVSTNGGADYEVIETINASWFENDVDYCPLEYYFSSTQTLAADELVIIIEGQADNVARMRIGGFEALDTEPVFYVKYFANSVDATGDVPVDPTDYNVGDAVTVLGQSTLALNGYTFGGWNTQADGEGTTYLADETFSMPAAKVSLYAIWDIVDYTITYNLDGGDNHIDNPATFTVEDLPFTMDDASKEGYTFEGWFDNDGFSGEPITQITNVGNKTFWAKFEIVNYTLTYNLDEGDNHIDNPATFTVNDLPLTLEDASKDGHTFEGWYNNAEFTGEVVNQISTIGNVELWAKFEPIPTYPVTFNVDMTPAGAFTTAHIKGDADFGGYYTGLQELTESGAWYTVTLNLPDGTYEYKYYTNDIDGAESIATSRSVTVAGEGKTINELWADTDAGAAINPTARDYDLTNPTNVTTTIKWYAATDIATINDGAVDLTETDHYTLVSNTLTIKKEYLATKLTAEGQSVALDITFDTGDPVTFTVNAIETAIINTEIEPAAATFDKHNPTDLAIEITWNDASVINKIEMGVTELVLDTDYTLDGTTLTFAQAYLAGLDPAEGDELVFTITFDVGNPATFTVTVLESAAIAPVTSTYDIQNPQDIAVEITWNDAASIDEIAYGATVLTSPADYTLEGNTLTILQEFFQGQSISHGDVVTLDFTFNAGADAALAVDVINSATIDPVAANFDLWSPANVETTIAWNGAASIESVSKGGDNLVADTDYQVAGDKLTILESYFDGAAVNDVFELVVTFDIGETATFTITVIDTEPSHATINPVAAEFDKYAPANVTTTVTWNDATEISSVKVGATELALTDDYTVTDIDGATATLTILEGYFSEVAVGDVVFDITFDVGNPAALTVTVVDNSPVAYPITIAAVVGGTADISTSPVTEAFKDDEVTVTIANIEDGKEFQSIEVKGADEAVIPTTQVTEGAEYTFTMPEQEVTIMVTLADIPVPSEFVDFEIEGNWTEDVASSGLSSYGNHTYSDLGVTIQGTNVMRNGDAAQDGFAGALGSYSLRIRNAAGAKALITVADGGVADFSLKVRRWDGSPIPDYTVKYSVDGGTTWVGLANINGDLLTTSDWYTYSATINSEKTNILIEVANTGTTERIMIDNFDWDGYVDTTAPEPTFTPANGATDVLTTVNPTIDFNEPVFVSSGVAVDNSNVAGLITFAGSDAVPFSATISDNVISIVPNAELDFDTQYTLTIDALEDEAGNKMSAPASVTFTTLSASAPVVTLTSTYTGEVYYAGDDVQVTWTTENVANINVELWTPSASQWNTIADNIDATAESATVTLPVDAVFAKEYKLRLKDSDSDTYSSESGQFTIRPVVTDILTIRGFDENIEFRFDGEAVVTFTRENRNQKYIQDDAAAVLIDDDLAVITSAYTIGDVVTGLVAKKSTYSGIIQVIPLADPGVPTKTADVIPFTRTVDAISTDDQSKLIKISDADFAETGNFSGYSNYIVTDPSASEITFRTGFSEVDYIDQQIPEGKLKSLVAIVGEYSGTPQITSRSLADFELYSNDASLSTFTLGGQSVLSLTGLKVNDLIADAGATLNVVDFTNFDGIEVATTNANATVEVKLNGTVVEAANLATQTLADGDVVLATVTAENESTVSYFKVTVSDQPSNEANILSFSFAEQTGNAVIGDGIIEVEVDHNADVTALVASFTLSNGATAKVNDVAQESGVTANDFTSPVTYVVTAQDGSTSKDWVVTVTQADEVKHTVTFSVVGGNGNVSAIVDNVDIASGDDVVAGSQVVFTADPATSYQVKVWALNGTPVADNTTNEFTIASLAANAEVTVEFEAIPQDTYSVTFSVVGGNGNVSATVDNVDIASGDDVDAGSEIVFTAEPAPNYKVKEWTLNGTPVADNTTNEFVIASLDVDITVTVEFEEVVAETYTVTFSVVEVEGATNGTLTAAVNEVELTSGDEVEEGSGVVFTATPNDGYKVKTWTLNGDPIADFIENSYTISELTIDVVITVEFEVITSVPTLSLSNVKAYPNPFTNTIKLDNSELVTRVVVTDMIGKQVMVIDLNGDNVINTSSLREGVYLIILENQNGQRVVRRMIKR